MTREQAYDWFHMGWDGGSEYYHYQWLDKVFNKRWADYEELHLQGCHYNNKGELVKTLGEGEEG
jgi:hypothetical protein